VLSTAKIGIEKVIPAMQQCVLCDIVAIASRKIEKVRAAAIKLGIQNVYGSYQELLNAPEIDAVYIPLPNHLHVSWSIKTLEAGKHVLCEKPLALTSAGARKLLDTAEKYPNQKIMEAFMYRHHPQWQRARQMIDEGKIGELRTIQSFFSYYNADPANIRNIAEVGGGALMDIDCYCVSLSRLIFGAEPRRICGIMEFDPQFKTDRLTSGILDFGRGTSTFTCATQLTPFQCVNIFGTDG
jgi:predicted dehydrogenase